MPHKKKALDQQESQQLAPESYTPLGREPMTGAQASYLEMLAEEVREVRDDACGERVIDIDAADQSRGLEQFPELRCGMYAGHRAS